MIHRIAATDDPRLAPYRHVGDAEWLRRHDLFVAEGRLVVARTLELGAFPIHSILVNPAALEALLAPLSAVDGSVYVCDDEVVAAVTGVSFHRGCLALVVRPAPRGLDTLRGARRLLALEGVGNPDNVGGLFRSAAAFGVDGVLLDAATGDPLYRKAVRTSMGATLRLPYVRLTDLPGDLETLRRSGFSTVALTPGADALSIDRSADLRSAERLVVLVGAEGPGLHRDTIELADYRVRIPVDESVDSLNVVVAASIALQRLRPPPS